MNRTICWVAASSLLVPLLSIGVAQAQLTTPGQFGTTPSGGATYSIPIQVPPGTAGVAPGLSLSYSSQGGNGLLGMGWIVSGLSAIGRCPSTLAQDNVRGSVNYNTSDRYCLDGQRLFAINGGVYGANGTEYRTEQEGFAKITSYSAAGNGPAWFKVQTKSGQIMEYGSTADSRIEAQGISTVAVWALNRVSDTKSNYLTITYDEDIPNAQYYPIQIDYTGNATKAMLPSSSVRLKYADRTDIRTLYRAGSFVKTTKRLTNVQTYAKVGTADVPVKDYRLTYDYSPTTQRSRLQTVQECDGAGVCLPATNVAWQSQPVTASVWSSAPNLTPMRPISADSMNNIGVQLLDVNSDGMVDMIYHRYICGAGTEMGAYLSNGSGWVSTPGYTPPRPISADCMNQLGVRFVDVNGDSLPDMIYNRYICGAGTESGAYLNTGSGWVTAPNFTPPHAISADCMNELGVRLIDVNGDGLVDMVYSRYIPNGGTDAGAYLNTGSGWVSAPNFTPPHPVSTDPMNEIGVRFVDMNGDGLPDMIYNRYICGNQSTDAGAYINTGSGWAVATNFTPPHAISADCMNNLGVQLLDVNGDGLVDMIYNRYMSNGTTDAGAYLNTGTGWIAATSFTPPHAISADPMNSLGVRFVDVNRDGLVDMIYSRYICDGGATDIGAYLNTGSGWQIAPNFKPPHTISADCMNELGLRLEDVNGNGLADMVYSRYMSNGTIDAGAYIINIGADIVDKVTNGLGAVTTITYKPITDKTIYTKDSGAAAATWPVVDLQMPMYVVSSVSSSNGLGGTLSTHHTYGGLKAQAGLTGRGSLGFRWNQVTQAESGLTTRTEYRQDFPYTGATSLVKKTLPGGGNGGLISQATNNYQCLASTTGADPVLNANPASCTVAVGINRRYFTYPSQSISSNWDLNGAVLPTTTTTSVYDIYGNPTQIVNSASDGYSTTTNNTYTNDVVNWFLGRLTRASVTTVTP